MGALFDPLFRLKRKNRMSMFVKKMAAALMLFAMASAALAGKCGCNSVRLTTAVVALADQAAPEAATAEGVLAAKDQLGVVLTEYSYAFNQDYATMSVAEREAHYARLDELRRQRMAAVSALADAYAAEGANPEAVRLLQGHVRSLDYTSEARVAMLANGEALMAEARRHRDALLEQTVAMVGEMCANLGTPDVRTCLDNAIRQSGRTAPGHLTVYAWPAGPLTQIAARLEVLKAAG